MAAPSPILTLTLNPAIDEAISIDALALGSTNRCRLDGLDPGGKGINASRVIRRLGRATLAIACTGGVTGALLAERLRDEDVPHAFVDVGGETRVNVMLYEWSSGHRTRLYLPGPNVDAAHLHEVERLLAPIGADAIAVLAGSLPPGLPADTYRTLARGLAARGIRTIVDTSGPALAAALESAPLLVKPNVEELEELVGRTLPDEAALLSAARDLQARGPDYVVISQGAEGALAVGPSEAWKVHAPAVEAISTVGSGDSMVAGLAIGFREGASFADALRLGAAAGAATAIRSGTQLGEARDVERLVGDVRLEPR